MRFRRVEKLRIQNGRTRHSAGFTMIELLTSIGIIALLASLLLVGFRGVWATAKKNKTKITILQLNQLMKQSLSAVDLARGQGKRNVPLVIERAFSSGNDGRIIDYFSDKFNMKAALPQRWQDMVGRDGTWGTADDTAMGKIIQGKISKGEMARSDLNGVTGSSEIVYLLFSEGSVYGVTLKDAGEFGADVIKDTDGDGLMEFVDAWDQPLRFYRWPTRLIRPNGILPYELDPNDKDPRTMATDIFWEILSSSHRNLSDLGRDTDNYTKSLSSQISDFMVEGDNSGNADVLSITLHTRDTYYSYLIISAGPDGILGLEEPTDSANFGHLARPRTDTDDSQNVMKIYNDYLDWLIANPSATEAEKAEKKAETISKIYDTYLGDDVTNLMQLEKK